MKKRKKTYLNLIREVDADFFIVHGRHGKEREKDKNDFSVYPECVKTNKVIIANGDVTSADQITYLKSIGVRGAMIGRAAVANPHIFFYSKTIKVLFTTRDGVSQFQEFFLIGKKKLVSHRRTSVRKCN